MVEKRPSFMDKLKAKFFKQPQAADNLAGECVKVIERRKSSSKLPIQPELLHGPISHSHTMKNRVRLEAIDHTISN